MYMYMHLPPCINRLPVCKHVIAYTYMYKCVLSVCKHVLNHIPFFYLASHGAILYIHVHVCTDIVYTHVHVHVHVHTGIVLHVHVTYAPSADWEGIEPTESP